MSKTVIVCVASSRSCGVRADSGVFGLTNSAMRVALGTSSHSNPVRLPRKHLSASEITMNKLTAPRPLLVDSPSDSGFATTSWGEQARPRLRAAETEGRLALLFYRAPAGFGPPRHLHRQDDEILLIEQGAIALWTPHECRTAGPGDVVMLPKVMPHTWRAYGDDPIRFQVTVTPGEFETFFERIVERNLTLADQAELVEVASAAGMDIVGPPLSDEEVAAIVGGER
jgi:mannose-6-phosphate isomerase-like protein (cupin superfamily)